ncbi:MAG: hypothetical protein BGO11_15470 [Solirubrobacterales bacterium 70-9]|nr:MAG: hypothetical protein BGO11_15470 [Solirubrobacterales bacterium 70-9]
MSPAEIETAIEREKDLLPFGWGRFGKSLEGIAEVVEPDEQLLAACIGLNPTFEHKSITLAGGLRELTKSTNVVLAATDRRLLVIATGAAGGTREHSEIPYAGMTIDEVGKRDLKLSWPDGTMRIKGLAKPMAPPLVDALRSKLTG